MKDDFKTLTKEQSDALQNVFNIFSETGDSGESVANDNQLTDNEDVPTKLVGPVEFVDEEKVETNTVITESKETTTTQKKQKNEDQQTVSWFDGKKINEVEFCDYYLKKHPVKYIMNNFYDIDGVYSMEKLRQEIFNMIRPYVTSSLQRRVDSLINALIITASCENIPISDDRVHVNNGTILLENMTFTKEKEFCLNRLPVNYNPDAAKPKKWLEFLNQLLYEEDIPTLQEYIGYTFIQTTRAQSMLLIIGNGGEGKSRVGLVIGSLLGTNMNKCPLDKLAKDKFCRADQEGKLLMIDDDMKMEALSETNIIKAIVTMEGTMDLERKGRQSVQGILYVRLIGFGNGTLSALYDKSDGFYRRQIVLHTREKPVDRKDDRMLIDKLNNEIEGIFLWCLEGLKRLIENDFHFTISDRAKKNLEESKKEDDNFIEFFESEGYVMLEHGTRASTKDLYYAYVTWCKDNVEKPRSEKSFSKYLKQYAEHMGLVYDKNMDAGFGKKVRGYYGIHVKIRSEEF